MEYYLSTFCQVEINAVEIGKIFPIKNMSNILLNYVNVIIVLRQKHLEFSLEGVIDLLSFDPKNYVP